MSGGRFVVEGELYLSLEVVAEVYEIQPVRLARFLELGLLPTRVVSQTTVVAAAQLDRVATIVRYEALGCDAELIAVLLAD